MDTVRAKERLTILADGINPLTGEVLPESDSCNQVEIVRALHTLLRTLEQRRDKSGKPLPENAGKPWTAADEAELCRMFDAGSTKQELCARFGRSSVAIAARLVRLGKIQNRDMFR